MQIAIPEGAKFMKLPTGERIAIPEGAKKINLPDSVKAAPTSPVVRDEYGGYAPPAPDWDSATDYGDYKLDANMQKRDNGGIASLLGKIGVPTGYSGKNLAKEVAAPFVADHESDKQKTHNIGQSAIDAIQMVDTLEESSKYSSMLQSIFSSGNLTPKQIEQAKEIRLEQKRLYDMQFQKQGLGKYGEDEEGNPYLITKDGNNIPLDNMWDNIQGGVKANKNTIIGSMAAPAMAFAKGAATSPIKHPYAQLATGLAYGAGGAFAGSLVDTASNAYTTGRDFDKKLLEFGITKAAEEGVADPLMAMAGDAVLKTIWGSGKGTIQGTKNLSANIKNYIAGENLTGAQSEVKSMGLDADKIHAQRTQHEQIQDNSILDLGVETGRANYPQWH